MANQIITVSGVKGYTDENNTAWLRLEDVARGLGFTEKKSDGAEYIRWSTVGTYLRDLNFSQEVAKDSYIPENIFYRLAMKAKNETAEAFQAVVADEILPAIRKTGTYTVKPMSQIEMIAATAQAMVDLEKRTSLNEQKLNGALNALAAPQDKDWQNATGDRIKRICAENGLNYMTAFGDLYKELETSAHVDLTARVKRLQERMKKAGATYKERQEVTKLHVIGLDRALKLAFDGIVRRTDAKYATDRVSQMCG